MKKLAKLFVILTALFAVVALASCAPKDSDAAKEKLDKAGYTAVWNVYDEVQEDGAVGYLVATKGKTLGGMIDGLGDGLTAVLYKTAKQAKAAVAEHKDAEGKSNYQVVGKWVVSGSEDAVKAFKK